MDKIIAPQRRSHDNFVKNRLFDMPMAKDLFEGNLPAEVLSLILRGTPLKEASEIAELTPKQIAALKKEIKPEVL